MVEMIFDSVLASPCNDNDVLDSRCHAFLDHILNERLINDGEHLFRLRFGGRQKSGAQTSGWKDGLAHASVLICHTCFRKLFLYTCIEDWKSKMRLLNRPDRPRFFDEEKAICGQ